MSDFIKQVNVKRILSFVLVNVAGAAIQSLTSRQLDKLLKRNKDEQDKD
jgi:hypothetical protein